MQQHVPLSGKLTLHVISAKGLMNADTIGKSDPYVRVQLAAAGKVVANYKTKVIDDDLNPKWKEQFHHIIPAGDPVNVLTLSLCVWDQDPGEDEFLGEVHIDVDSHFEWGSIYEAKLKGRKDHKDKGVKGTISFSIDHHATNQDIYDTSKLGTYKHGGRAYNTKLGPILHFRGCNKHEYGIAILMVASGEGGDNPDLQISPPPVGKKVTVTKLLSEGDRHVWIYDFAMKQQKEDMRVDYFVCGKSASFYVPGIGCPVRFVATSCNGFHDPNERAKLKHPEFNLYTKMKDLHEKRRFLLNLGGGDQLYCDPVWNLPGLKKFEPGDTSMVKKKFTDEMSALVNKFYMDNYISSWNSPEMSAMYASIPNAMTWDDHDIFDGWGSYPSDVQACPIYQGIWKWAELYYCAFQLGCTPTKLPAATLPGKHAGKTQMYVVGDVGIANLDLRTERSKKVVCADATYQCLQAWLDQHHDLAHLIVVSSIPICYNDFSLTETTMSITGGEMLDDLLDHWRAKDHQKERKMFIKMLFEYANTSNTRVTIISGDVHIGAIGAMHHKKYLKRSNAGEINCLITSAIVNNPPPSTFVDFLSLSAGQPEKVDSKIVSGLCKFQPRKKWYYIPNRNFMIGEETTAQDIFCHWIAENAENDTDNTLLIQAYKTDAKPDQTIENKEH
jgi:hypothetical protein